MKTHLQIATEAFRKVYNLPDASTDPEVYLGAGSASHGGAELTEASSLAGLVPSSITWGTDRGNWAWDGALATLEAVGLDVRAPLPEA